MDPSLRQKLKDAGISPPPPTPGPDLKDVLLENMAAATHCEGTGGKAYEACSTHGERCCIQAQDPGPLTQGPVPQKAEPSTED